jgi:hypothetical protein
MFSGGLPDSESTAGSPGEGSMRGVEQEDAGFHEYGDHFRDEAHSFGESSRRSALDIRKLRTILIIGERTQALIGGRLSRPMMRKQTDSMSIRIIAVRTRRV